MKFYFGNKLYAACATLIALSVTSAHAEVLSNGGFETGNFSGWTVGGPDTGGCGKNFNVGTSGMAAGCVSYNPFGNFVTPHSGSSAAYAAFDGEGPLARTLTQTFAIPVGSGSASVTWHDAIGLGDGWLFNQARGYSVDLLDGSGNLVSHLMSKSFNNQPGGLFQNWTEHTVDISSSLSSLSGHNAELRFTLTIPETYTGPAVYALDDVSVQITAVPEPETYAMMLAGLGLLGFMRRRKN